MGINGDRCKLNLLGILKLGFAVDAGGTGCQGKSASYKNINFYFLFYLFYFFLSFLRSRVNKKILLYLFYFFLLFCNILFRQNNDALLSS